MAEPPDRRRSRVPWILLAVAAPVFVATVVISILNDGFFEPFTILAVGMIVGYAGVGALVASREPANPIGWIMMVMGLGFLATGLSDEAVTFTYVTDPGSLPFGSLWAWMTNWTYLVALGPAPLLIAVFPTGVVLSQRWRFLPIAWLVTMVVALFFVMFAPGPIDHDEVVLPNPLAHRCARRSDRRPRWARGVLVAGTHDRRRRLPGPAISPGVGRGAAADQVVRVRVAPLADRGAARVPRRRRDARSAGGRGLLLPVLRDLRGRHPRRGRRCPAPVPPVRPRPRREEGRGVRHPRRVALPDRHGRRRRGVRPRVRALRRRAGDDHPRRRDDRRGPAAALRSRPADRRPRRLWGPGEPVRGPRRLHAADGGVLRGRRRPPADGGDPPRSGGRDDRSRVAGRGGRAAARGRRARRRARAGGAAGASATRCRRSPAKTCSRFATRAICSAPCPWRCRRTT